MNIECDRCKKIYNADDDTKIEYLRRSIYNVNEYHLCTKCGDLLHNFVELGELSEFIEVEEPEWKDDEDYKVISESPLVIIVNPKYKHLEELWDIIDNDRCNND